eukprot:scaffold13476_cov105-Cyclotella_meneghiniana.AAC.3
MSRQIAPSGVEAAERSNRSRAVAETFKQLSWMEQKEEYVKEYPIHAGFLGAVEEDKGDDDDSDDVVDVTDNY